jgi:peptidoglycan/LPS O-acetylase OafA/YrhL
VSLALPLTAVLAWLSWRVIEAPAIRLKPRARPSAAATSSLAVGAE